MKSLKYLKKQHKLVVNLIITPFILFSLFFQIVLYIQGVNNFSSWMLIYYGIVGITLIVYLCYSNINILSPFFIIILYSIISHFGYFIVALFQKDYVYSYLRMSRHLYLNTLGRALQISTIGITLMIFGYRLRNLIVISKKTDKSNKKCQKKMNIQTKENYLRISYIIIYSYSLILVYYAINYNLLHASYFFVKEVLISSSIFVIFRTLFWVAIIPISIFINKKVFKIVIVPIMIIFIILLFSGNRNDILYPLAVGYSLYCYSNKKTSKLVNILSLVILFVINPAIADNRQTGSILNASYSFKVLDSIMEMGAQIRPLSATIHLIERGIISHLHGMTIIAPTLAVLNLGLVYTGNNFSSSMYFIPNILAIGNHYGQGYSMIAELWLNFGIVGLIFFCTYLGYKCASVEKNNIKDCELIKYGGWSMLLFYWVRNSLQMNFIIILFTYFMIFICENFIFNKRGK